MLPFASHAQGIVVDKEIFNVCATIFVLALLMIFILYLLRQVMDHRLKNKIIEKGVGENIISTILKTSNGDSKHTNIKWFALLSGLGIGLFLVKYTLPLGFHSLGIMSFSLASAFLAYYFFLKRSEN
jgi:hypothetical protein